MGRIKVHRKDWGSEPRFLEENPERWGGYGFRIWQTGLAGRAKFTGGWAELMSIAGDKSEAFGGLERCCREHCLNKHLC